MQILVCGASGLIGPAGVRRLLADGRSVTALDVALNPARLPPASDRLTLRRGDVGDLGDVLAAARESDTRRIINLAFVLPPESESNPRLALRVNVFGMANVFEAARLLGLERVVYASSVAAHGGQEHFGERGVNEADDCFPINLYGASKYFDDIVARRYIELYGVDLVGVRIATVFGYGRETGNTAWIGKLASLPALGQPAHCPALGPAVGHDLRRRRGGDPGAPLPGAEAEPPPVSLRRRHLQPDRPRRDRAWHRSPGRDHLRRLGTGLPPRLHRG